MNRVHGIRSELLELGLYLQKFHDDPAIDQCIKRLKIDKEYESCLFQLAMAYRLRKVGQNVSLEPPTDFRNADIAFEYQGKKYTVECYRINRLFNHYHSEFKSHLYHSLFDQAPKGKVYCYTVELNRSLSLDGMRRLLRDTEELISEFNSRPDLVMMKAKIRGYIVGIEDITGFVTDPDFPEKGEPGGRYQDYDVLVSQSWVWKEVVFDLSSMPNDRSDGGSRVYLWRNYNYDIPKSSYDVLMKKMDRKLRQTKLSNEEAGRMLFVDFPIGLAMQRAETTHRKIQHMAVSQFSNVSCIFLFERSPGYRMRAMYHGVCLFGEESNAPPESFVQEMGELEMEDIFSRGSHEPCTGAPGRRRPNPDRDGCG